MLTLTLTNTANTLDIPYNVTVTNPSYTGATDAFNWQVSRSPDPLLIKDYVANQACLLCK